MSPLSSWRLPLRLARRDALRHRARSLLVLVMIALPVLAVTAADVLIQTQHVSGAESVARRLGAAQAMVVVSDGVTNVEQPPDPDNCCSQPSGDGKTPAPSAEQVSSLLDGAKLLELRRGDVEVRTDKGQTLAGATEVDLRDPLTRGMFDLTSGRWPRATGEVVVNQALLDKGYRIGDQLDLTADGAPAPPTIVGVAESATTRTSPVAAGPVGSLGVDASGSAQWLVGGAPVSWALVRQLNKIGALVASREVISDPPPVSEWPADVRPAGTDNTTLAVLGLIAVMALIEVVLLAGPAFAVTARKQQRSLALMAATGGTPKQSRRVVVASAVVLGSVAAVAGVVVGIGVARLLQPLLQSRSHTWFGPFEVPWTHLLGVAGFGMLSALLAAIVPAYIASRQDVVAVLAGRRGDRAPSLRSPMLGLVLLGIGIAGSVAGARGMSVLNTGEFLIALSAIPAVLGMILLVPVVLAGVARLSGPLPLVVRYAVRDANRHRTRTVPAVSAVAATVAGVVALGIGLSSDQAESRATYTPSLAAGVGIVQAYTVDPPWPALRAVVTRELPQATVAELQGLSDRSSFTEVRTGRHGSLDSTSGSLGATVMVSADRLPPGLIGVSGTDADRAAAMLRRGGVVAFVTSSDESGASDVKVVHSTYDVDTGEGTGSTRTTAPAVFVRVPSDWMGPSAVLAPAVAQRLKATPETVSLAVTGVDVSKQQEQDIDEGLSAVGGDAGLYVERGYQPPDSTVIAQIVLIVLGAVLMLGGTLTATFLALSDARPDLATLSAVGAAPRTRRGVAAAYAVVVGVVGAVLGAAVGLIPGIAVTWPLTSGGYSGGCGLTDGHEVCSGTKIGPFLDVPWLLVIALVVVLPAVTALVVGLCARSRLPLVARLD
jgi:putative ABC transport system permease protein